MEEKIQELEFNNYEDIQEEIIYLQEKLKQPIANQVKKKEIEQNLSGCLEVQALYEEIQKILYKNNQPNLNNDQFEKEYNELLEELGTTLEEIQQDIEDYKHEIQLYIGKNSKREKQAREKLVKYERLHELAQILQKYQRNTIPNQKIKQVYDQVENNQDQEQVDNNQDQEQEEFKSITEQREAALKEHKQQKLIEAIVANYDRTKNNVQSFEKSLNECLYYLWNKIQPIQNAKEIANEELLRLIEDLQLREQIEELGVYQELNEAISYIKATQNYEKVFDTLKVLAFNSSLIAFNFLEFIYLMDLVEHSSNIIQNKDIILFLGVTGSGKSTTIQYLCGQNMKAMRVKGLNHIEAVDVKDNQLKNIKSSPFAKSETRYVTPIKLNLKDIKYFKNQEVILVDSPGSGDLESVELDLVNTLGIYKSVRQAKSVRLVLLFGYQNLGNRFEHLKEQLKFYSSIIDDLQENCKAITYAFTQIPQDQTDQIEFKLQNIYEELNKEELNNNDLKSLLEDAIEKSLQKEIIIINPLDKQPLKVFLKILKSKKIDNPRSSFKFTMSSKAKASLYKEFGFSKSKIENSIIKNNEFPLAIEKLKILKSVTKILEDDKNTQNLYKNVMFSTKRIFQLYGDKIREFIKRHQVVENVIQEAEIKEVKDIFIKLNYMKPIQEELFDDQIQKDDDEIKGTSHYEIAIRQLALKISSDLKEREIDDRMWDVSLANIEIFQKEFELCSEIDTEAFKYYQEKTQQHLELQDHSVRNEFERETFEKMNKENSSQSESSILFSRLIKARETLKNPKYLRLLDYSLKQQEEQIKQKFENIYNENIQIFIIKEDYNPNFNNDGALQINNYLQLLESFYLNYNQQSEKLKSFFEQQQSFLKSKMLQLFNKSLQDFKDFLKQENDTKLKQTYDIILNIRSIKAFQNDTYSQYFQLSYDIHQQMKHNKVQIDSILHSITESDINFFESKLRQLRSSLRKVQQLSKIMDHEELRGQFKEEVLQELGDWKESLMRKIPPKVSGIFQHDKLEEICKVHNLFLMIEKCYSLLQIEDSNLSNDLKGQLDETFERIEFQITQIGINYTQFSVNKRDFDLLYKHFISIKIALKHHFDNFQNNHSKSTIMLSVLEQNIQQIVKKQVILISSELKKFFEQLYNLSENIQVNTEQQLFQEWKKYDNITEMIISKVQLINDAEIHKNEFFEIMIDEDYKIKESLQKQLLIQNKQIKSKLDDVKNIPNIQIQQIYLAFAESQCNFDSLLPEQQQMKNVYEEYQKIFSKNQSQTEFYKEIEKELCKDPYSCKKINEQLMKIQKFESDASNILFEIENLFILYVKKLSDKIQFNEEGNFIQLGNAEAFQVIIKLKKMQQKIDPKGILIDGFRESINQTLIDLEVQIEQFLSKKLDLLDHYIGTDQFQQVDILFENNKTLLKAFQILNKNAFEEYQYKFDKCFNELYEVLKQGLQGIDKGGLNYIKQVSSIFIDDELKNKELQNLFTLIKTKVQNKIKEEIDEYEHLENQDDQIEGIKILETIFKLLPVNYTKDLIQQKKILEDKLQKIQIEESNLIDQLQIKMDFKELYRKYETAKNIKKRQKIEDFFSKMASEQTLNAQNSFQQLNIAGTLQFLSHAYEPLQFFQKNLLSHIQSQFDFTIQCLTDKIKEWIISIYQYKTKQLQEEQISQNIMQIQSYYKVFKNTQILHQNKELMNTKEIIDKLFQDFTKDVINLQNSVNQNISNKQNFKLHQLIKDYQEYQKFFQILKFCSENKFIKLIGHQPLIFLEEDNFGFSQVEQYVIETIQDIFNFIRTLSLMQDGNESERAHNHQSIDKINNNLDCICSLQKFSVGNIIQETIQSNRQQFDKAIEVQYRDICYNIDQLVPKLFESDIQNQKRFNNYYLNLVSMAQNIKSMHLISSQTNTYLNDIKLNILQKIESLQKIIVQVAEQDNEEASKLLINLQKFSQNIILFQTYVSAAFQQIFVELKQVAKDFSKVVQGLYQYLKDTTIGMSIIQENPIFTSQQRAIFNRKIQAFGIDHILKNLTDNNNQIDLHNLRKCYDQFQTIFKQKIQTYLTQKMEFSKLVKEIKDRSKSVVNKGNDFTDYIPELVALIFALWSLINATTFFNPDPSKQSNDYLLQPHPAQVISIFRILGIGYLVPQTLVGLTSSMKLSNSLMNNLVEIRTGEGKSITLGVVSIIFALIGYKVNCACYSEYLSQRDLSSFSSLFEQLEVQDKIYYGTFNQICEKMINKKGDIREMIMKQVLKDYKPQKVQLSKDNQNYKEVLLIDEVDVFFSKSFYGALYQPKVSIYHNKIKDLILYIWQNQTKELKLEDIKNQQVYLECQSIFNHDYVFLLDEALKNMLFDLGELKNHKEYECIDGLLGYKEQDYINFKISIGYLTMWANCKECAAKQVTPENRDKQLCLGLKCGAFSYAEIAKDFEIILGVSGTLKTLTDIEKGILKKYSITSLTFIPSAYGENNLSFKQIGDILITDKEQQYLDFIRNIQSNIIRNGYERSVIIIFEDEKKLQDFFDCEYFADIRSQRTVIRLTEKCNDLEKKNFVREATQSGHITLATKIFGRGTDFISLDKELNNNGGIHVIQTFFSTSLSEEVQIKGRTARQGSHGSYCMILLDSELSQFNFSLEEISELKKMKDVYPQLNEKRNAALKTVQEIETKGIEQKIKKPHQEAIKFRQNLLDENQQLIVDTLLQFNKGKEQSVTQIRTLILLDATGSMSGLILNTKNEIQEICQRVQEILKQINSPLIFQIQIAAYRNYNAPPELILENSPWETNYENLRSFLDSIESQYGMGQEAIEIGLWHAGQQVDILSQVLLIGDAPPNDQSRVKKYIGCKPYSSTKFSRVNYYEKELETLIKKKVPVHAYYVDSLAKKEFQKIANLTRGKCSFLDVNSSNGSDQLRDSIAKLLLSCAGQSLGVQNLEELYDKYYGS